MSQPLRTEPRTLLRVQLKVATTAWDGSSQLWTKDVSPGGIYFLYAERVLPQLGSKAAVEVAGQTLEAQVAHVMSAKLAAATGAEAGFGIQFTRRQPPEWWAALAPKPAAAAPAPAVPPPKPAASPPRPHLPGPKEHASAKALYQAGVDLLRAKNYGGARQKFELAGRLVPDPQTLAMPLVCNGFQFLRLGVADQARAAFQRALLLSPHCAEAKDGLAQVSAPPKPAS